MTEIEEIIKKAAEPHLIASAKDANLLLAKLNAILADLRGEVRDLELKADLELNRILKTDIAIERGKAQWRVGDIYQNWKQIAGLLSDVRAVRRSLERHSDLLYEQEKFKPRRYGDYERAA